LPTTVSIDLDKRREATRVDAGIVPVFAGGTCLSNAHRLIERMSEDIDIKVLLHSPAPHCRAKFGKRSRLKVLHESVLGAFQHLQLPLSQPRAASHPHSRDQHRYCSRGARYQSGYEAHASLRSELQL
jgi:hypothetical protein